MKDAARRWMRCLVRLRSWTVAQANNVLHADQRKCSQCGHVDQASDVLWSGWGNHYVLTDRCSKCCEPNAGDVGRRDGRPPHLES